MKALRELLMTPAANLGRAGRFVVFQYKLWAHCLRLLRKNRAEQLAAALSYYTIFGLVPLGDCRRADLQLRPRLSPDG